jgi:molybdopterin converting factor small subunit
MEIFLDCYGVTARLAGGPQHCLRLVPGAAIGDALAQAARRWPDLARVLPDCACAIGDRVVPRTRPLAAGERLALLPPVSGG